MVQVKAFKLKIDSKSIKTSEDGKFGYFEGYLAVFGNVDSYGDIIQPGAFKRTIDLNPDGFVLLWQHDTYAPVGKLTGKEDDHGLFVKGELNLEVEKAREAYALLKQGAIKGMSIGYETVKSDTQKMGDIIVRLLQELKLWEGSLVTFPANALAMVTGVKGDVPAVLTKLDRLVSELQSVRDTYTVNGDTKPIEEKIDQLRASLSPGDPAAGHSPEGKAAPESCDPGESHSLVEMLNELKAAVSA